VQVDVSPALVPDQKEKAVAPFSLPPAAVEREGRRKSITETLVTEQVIPLNLELLQQQHGVGSAILGSSRFVWFVDPSAIINSFIGDSFSGDRVTEVGLSGAEASERLRRYGPNVLSFLVCF
jgi:hypothetical protein